jgi:hypothetical protein
VADRRLRGEIDVDERVEPAAEGAEKMLEGGFEIGVSRSEENSKPVNFPKCNERGGNEVEVGVVYMPLMYEKIREMTKKS